jgi:hypothetical protein
MPSTGIYLSVGWKIILMLNFVHIRVLQLVYKMMLDSEFGPRYQINAPPAACVPPTVVDVVYKLLFSAPCS